MLIALCKVCCFKNINNNMLGDFKRAFDPNPGIEFKIIIIKKNIKIAEKNTLQSSTISILFEIHYNEDFNINNNNNCVTPSPPILILRLSTGFD